MSESEYTRLSDKIEDVRVMIGGIVEKLCDYPQYKNKVDGLDTRLQLVETNCLRIQGEKRTGRVRWGDVKGAVIGGLIVGIPSAVFMIIGLLKK